MYNLQVHYSFFWISVSVLLAVVSSITAMISSYRIRAANSPGLRHLWLASSSIVLGLGFWSMHFLGELAVTLPVPIFYSWPTVLMSFGLAIAASSIAMYTVAGAQPSTVRHIVGGALAGACISAMHFTGMAALRSIATAHYTMWLVVLSVFLSVTFSLFATWMAASPKLPRGARGIHSKVGAGIVMSAGVVFTHYVATAGRSFTSRGIMVQQGSLIHVDDLGRILITLGVGLVVVFAFCMAMLDTWRHRQLRRAEVALKVNDAQLSKLEQLRDVNRTLNELSVRDSLTGLFNRRYFDAALQAECNRAGRTAAQVSLLMMDLDCFKALNDHYGHVAGDACLRSVASCLAKQKRRSYDTIARYGGEEFVLLLPGVSEGLAGDIAETLRQAVEDLQITHEYSRVRSVVTISIGIACKKGREIETPEAFLRLADKALYKAKGRGGNCVCTTLS